MEAFLLGPHDVKEAIVFDTVISETNSIHFHSFPPSDQFGNRIWPARPTGLAGGPGQMQKPGLVLLMSFTARNSRSCSSKNRLPEE
jgi:hypothetical protein